MGDEERQKRIGGQPLRCLRRSAFGFRGRGRSRSPAINGLFGVAHIKEAAVVAESSIRTSSMKVRRMPTASGWCPEIRQVASDQISGRGDRLRDGSQASAVSKSSVSEARLASNLHIAKGNEAGSPHLVFIDGFVAGHEIVNSGGSFQRARNSSLRRVANNSVRAVRTASFNFSQPVFFRVICR